MTRGRRREGRTEKEVLFSMVLAVDELVLSRRVGERDKKLVSLGLAKLASSGGYHRFVSPFLPSSYLPTVAVNSFLSTRSGSVWMQREIEREGELDLTRRRRATMTRNRK